MPILGHGIDIIDTARVADMIRRHSAHFLDRCFTQAEQRYCGRGKRAVEHYAGRFAAKEAVFKALGTGWRGKMAWTDMEILPDAAGKPQLVLSGACARHAADAGMTRWHISITHISTHALASAIAEG